MKRIKRLFSWFMQVGLSILVVIFLCFAPFSLLPSLIKAESEVNKTEKYEYQGILELWHVETFEGGSMSRSLFLEREAVEFEREHKGTYIVIQTMTLEQFKLNINSGKKPNMLSFGIGVGNEFLSDLVCLNENNVRQDLLTGGKINSHQYAIPYILGGYALISNGNGSTGYGTKGVINPLKALQKNQIQLNNVVKDDSLDSYNAYDKFIKDNFNCLVGTQRDVYRCYSRQQKGLLLDAQFSFLGGYTDLVQYISVFNSSNIEVDLCEQFVSKLISNQTQKKLSQYNLFSVLSNTNLYQTEVYAEFETILKKQLEVENVFLKVEQIESQKESAYKSVVG